MYEDRDNERQRERGSERESKADKRSRERERERERERGVPEEVVHDVLVVLYAVVREIAGGEDDDVIWPVFMVTLEEDPEEHLRGGQNTPGSGE